jgi:hypothetical protein
MSKVLSIIVFCAFFIIGIQNSSCLFASTSRLKIEQIKILNSFVSWPDWKSSGSIEYEELDQDGFPINLALSNGAENISFRFNKSKKKEIKYRFKLTGQSETWKYADHSEWVKFDKVKDGKYCFVLQEIEHDKVTQEVTFNFCNKLNEFWIKDDIFCLIVTFVFILGIIKMK